MKQKENRPSIILVLGMHRSGTSLVAQMVANWGVNMGNDLMEANEFNQDGYWEYNPLVNLHDKMLAYTGNTWYAPPQSIDVPHFIKVFGSEARALVDEMDAGQNTWCWKDPRMALFLPFWQELLKERNFLFLISYRNPLTVADSLKTRDNIPTITATALWELYNLKILGALKNTDSCFFAPYEKLIDKSDECTKQLFDFLNTQIHEKKSSETLAQMRSAIKPGLKHSLPPQNISIDKQQNELYTLLQNEQIPEKDIEYLRTRLRYALEITDLYHKGNYYKERNLQLQLFYKPEGGFYSEGNSFIQKYKPNTHQVVFDFDSLSNIEALRFDPLNGWAHCTCGQIEVYNNSELLAVLKPVKHNAKEMPDGTLFFATHDPQVYFNLNHYKNLSFNKLVISFNYLKIGSECKMFFADNPGLFFSKLLSDGESQKTTDNSYSALFKQLEEKINIATNRFTEQENLQKQNDVVIDELYKQKLLFEKTANEQKSIITNFELTVQKQKAEIQNQLKQIAENEQEVRNFEVLVEQKEEAHKRLETIVNTHTQTIQSLKKETSNLQKTIDALNYEKEKLETALFASFTENETYKVELAGIKHDLNIAQNEYNSLLNKAKAKENRLLELQSELEKRNTTIEEQNTKYKELSQELQKKEKQMQEERNRLEQELKNTNETLQRHMDNERTKLVRQYRRRLPIRLTGNLLRFIKHPLQYYRMRRDTLIIRRSGLFDDAWYLQQYPDLYLTTVDMLQHYMLYGAAEGRNPSCMFDANYYLNENPDVKEAGYNPLLHFVLHGKKEGRKAAPTQSSHTNIKLNHNEQRNEDNILKYKEDNECIKGFSVPVISKEENMFFTKLSNNQIHEHKVLINSNIDWTNFFNYNNKLFNIDDPVEYYVRYYRSQHLIIPNFFDTELYLSIYPDIEKANINPLVHYLQHGINEKRICYFNLKQHIREGKKTYDSAKRTLMNVCHESSATGAPLVGLNLGNELSERFNIINVIIREDSINSYFIDNSLITVTNLLYYPVTLLKSILEQIHTQYSLDAVICNSIVSLPILEAASQLQIPTITLLHEFSSYSKPIGQVARSIILSDRIIVPATIIKDSALDEFHQLYNTQNNPPNITIAPQGKLPFIPEGYGENSSVEELQKKLKITNRTTKVIIGAGYIQIRKGVDLFISVAEKINEYYKGDVRFVWVGDGYDPEVDYNYSLWLKIQLDSSNIKDKFTFLPHQKNLGNILQITDCFILSSRLDPFPNVVIDALDSDIFVACFEGTTGCAEFIQRHNANGTVVPYLDVEKMALQVSDYLSLPDIDRVKKNGINRSIVTQHLDFSRYSALIEKEIESAISFVEKRNSIIKNIQDSKLFDLNFYSTAETSNEIDFYVKSSLKGVHIASPLPGFSEKKWINENKLDEYCVPIWEAIKRNKVKPTHKFSLLEGEQIKPKIKIAVHLHLYYIDLIEEFSNYLQNISIPFDLFITVPILGRYEEIKELSKLKNVRQLEIIEVENIGRDIMPLFINLKNKVLKGGYDIIGHFHSKKTIKNADMGDRWRHYIFDNLMGEEKKLNQLFNQFNDKNTGLVFAEDSHSVDISKNLEFANELCEAANLPQIKNAYVFPLGTMFWARPKALKPFFDLDFSNFIQPEPLPEDGTYLHAIERLIPHCAEVCGFKYKTVYTEGTKW